MRPTTYITERKLCAELKKMINMKFDRGGAISVLLSGFMLIIIILIVFVLVLDYGMYSYKKKIIGKGIDYAVCAAVQEIDMEKSSKGLETELDEEGRGSTDNIFIDKVKANVAFFDTLKENTGINKDKISGYLMSVIVNPTATEINYIIKKDTDVEIIGSVNSPDKLEEIINDAIDLGFSDTYAGHDENIIFVNSNPKTNQFKKRPYYIVFIKNYEIDGLIKKRTATFVGFSGAKIERKQ